jgi:5-dehydro-2-deoxygluconokinase
MRGYDKPLYILPFDHRGSFQKGLFGVTGTPTPAETAEIASYKRVIYDGFLASLEQGVPVEKGGILVDEQFGADIVRDATSRGIAVAMPTEKSGQDEFDFEYGEDFTKHIEDFDPTFVKVLVRYNPDADDGMNRRQTERLARLGRWLADNGRLYLFELLVPATDEQLASLGGDKSAYDEELRPKLMIRAIEELHEGGVDPDVWKIEGITSREDCKAVVDAARADGRDRVGCIVLGRGADEAKVLAWLRAAAGLEGYIGFAVGRTTFWDALVALKEGKVSREDATAQIAASYKKFVDLFEEAAS